MNQRLGPAVVCFVGVTLINVIVVGEAQAMRWIWGRSVRTLSASGTEAATTVNSTRSVPASAAVASRPSGFPATVTAGKNGWIAPTVTKYSDGSVAMSGLRERVAAGQAMSRPWLGRPLNLTLSDVRFPASAGWIKMSQKFHPGRLPVPSPRLSPPVVVHYNLNRHTGQVADPKVRLQTLTRTWQDAQKFRSPPRK